MKNLKILIIISMLLTTSLFSQNNKEFKVSYNPSYAPFSYSLDDEAYGLFIDIWKIWGEKNKYNIVFVNGKTWDGALELAKKGQVDFFLGTDPYKKWMQSSQTYYKTKTSIFKLKNNLLKINTIGIIGDDYKKDLTKEFPKSKIYIYKTYQELVNALEYKEVDAVYDDAIAFNDFVTLNRKNHLIKKFNIHTMVSNVKAISKNYRKISIFNEGFNKLDKRTLQDIESGWIPTNTDTYFNQTNLVILTETEKEWLKNNPINRVAIMSYWPHTKKGDSLHTGVLELINQYAGTNLIYVKYDAWKDGFNKAVEGEKIHGIMGLSWSAQRETDYFYYTPAYNFTPCYLVTKYNSKIKSLSDVKNKSIYLKTNSITHKMIEDRNLNIKVINKPIVKDIYKILSLSNKDTPMLSYFINEDELRKYNLKIAKDIYDKYGEVAIGINHKYPELASIINKALKAIPREKMSHLRERMDFDNRNKLKLTSAEKSFIRKKYPIKYVYDSKWKPLEWKNGLQKHTGIIADLMDIIQERSGLNLIEEPSETWKMAIKKVKDKKANMFSAIGETKERKEYLDFTTQNLLTTPYVFVSRQGDDFIDGFKSISNKKIAVNQNSTIAGILKDNKPNVKLTQLKKTDANGFIKLQNGEIDIFVVNAIKARYYINALGFKDLKIAYKTKFNLKLKMAVSHDMPKEVISILDKSIASINDKTLDEIFTKWTKVRISNEPDWEFIIKIVAVIIFILLYELWNNAKLQGKVKEKTKELQYLYDEIEKTQKEVIFTMGVIGESRSKETGNHVKRVALYSYILAKKYGLSDMECNMLRKASPMHDIGKVAIPDIVLNKPGIFNADDRVVMNTHAQLGFDLLKYSDRPLMKMASIVAYEHHEKWDGTGYPNKTSGEQIHIYGRITAIADVFDALGSIRVYKDAWNDEKIFNMFKEEKGKHFDPKLIDIFFDNLDEFLEVRDRFIDK